MDPIVYAVLVALLVGIVALTAAARRRERRSPPGEEQGPVEHRDPGVKVRPLGAPPEAPFL